MGTLAKQGINSFKFFLAYKVGDMPTRVVAGQMLIG
jgi:hypothetical protein